MYIAIHLIYITIHCTIQYHLRCDLLGLQKKSKCFKDWSTKRTTNKLTYYEVDSLTKSF